MGQADRAIVDEYPIFSWHESESCTPEKFQIGISLPDSPTTKGGSARYPLGSQTEFTWPDPLDRWNVYLEYGC